MERRAARWNGRRAAILAAAAAILWLTRHVLWALLMQLMGGYALMAMALPLCRALEKRLKPGLAAAAKEIPSKLIQAEEDILSYCLFPEVALGYFKWRAQPADAKDPIPADVEMPKKDEAAAAAPALSAEDAKFVQIGKAFAALMASCGGQFDAAALAAAPVAAAPAAEAAEPAAVAAAEPEGEPVLAPLNGTFYRSAGPGKPELAADGATVKAGEPCCIVEAMKLFNPIKTTAAGKITFLVKHGEVVQKGQKLAVIA